MFLADTVYVMSKSPGRFVVKREIELPRPRELELTYTKEFTDIVHELRGHIGASAQAAAASAGGGRAMTHEDSKQLERWSPWLLLVAIARAVADHLHAASASPSSSSRARGGSAAVLGVPRR